MIPYIVQAGDTLSLIAEYFNLPYDTLVQVNYITGTPVVYPGQTLMIPLTSTKPVRNRQPVDNPSSITPQQTIIEQGFIYIVQPTESLFSISLRFNVSVESLADINNIPPPYTIFAGQRLIIPTTPPQAPPGSTVHIVEQNDTIFQLSQRYNVTQQAIIRVNRILRPDIIFPGQRLIIPPPGTDIPMPVLQRTSQGFDVLYLQQRLIILGFDPGPQDAIYGTDTEEAVKLFQQSRGLQVTGIVDEPVWTEVLSPTQPPPSGFEEYIIQPGDTLTSIAQQFNVSVDAIVQFNSITNPDLIFPGQRLIIPIA
ncbi:MAG TPA: LysM peptidoglycan-binding domain-containing protein [Clostridiales bacterium]|nr:LysM peptidoglycan-binding domain-containing protein [Clostridiales bacterium]